MSCERSDETLGAADAEKLILSERDSLRMLNLLEHPPASSERLWRAARASFVLE